MVEGFDLKMLKDGDDKAIDAPLWVKFVEMNGNQIGNISEAMALTDEEFFWRTPAAPDQTKAIMYLSYNKQDWQAIIPAGKDFTFLYYDAPILTAITPHFGPVKNPGKKSAILTGLHFLCPDTSCKDLMVRFGDDDFGTLVPGKLLSST